MTTFPKYLGIIMDGNRRWAANRGLSLVSGYRKGIKTLKKVVEHSNNLNVHELTVFAFSTENWSRKSEEIDIILSLIEWYLKSEIAELVSNNISFKVVGDQTPFSQKVKNLIQHSEKITSNNNGMKLNVALNYGGKMDIVHAVNSLFRKFKDNNIDKIDITESMILEEMYTSKIKPFDLLIRTSGEQRISNFLLWHIAYSEIFFTSKLWPDFDGDDLIEAFKRYSVSERRFGSSTAKSKSIK